ncbi:antiviral reverse transcriptase Drt3a [Shewanella sp. SG41-3]|uniref:antiviral reverse transcriptase Drt3a n=1 Tax=Shewanella sp. SG41-3 TaxID=2760977 RepID=UPI0016025660|nr:antiviral reverse transcriptase Drt3a [Shewanella sp. SG41-3]MBB1477732.1 RNA-directed DNA polymerase [Shewanella sp. SG41-3]
MFDQSFSAQNLYYIYKSENNNGNNVFSKLFPEVIDCYEKIKRLKSAISKHYSRRRNYSKDWFDLRVRNLYLLLKLLKRNRDEIISKKLEIVSKEISSKDFYFEIKKSLKLINNKAVYSIGNSASSLFAEKQIQRNIRYTYGVKQNDRDLIIPQLYSCLNNKYPFHIIRTDIKSFYESISPVLLLKKLNESAALSLSSRKIIAKLLRSYKVFSDKGIPRGIGISAYLAELYLKDFDFKIRSLENLVFYARYVDDIILIVTQKNRDSNDNYLDLIKSYLEEEELELSTELEKTSVHSTFESDVFEFDYLGYSFKKQSNSIEIGISKKKKDKYISKIKFSIDKYNNSYIKTPKLARAELMLRLRFLTIKVMQLSVYITIING